MKEQKWSKNNVVIAVLIIFFFPLGLFLMWKNTKWNKDVKLGLTFFVLTALVFGLFSSASTPLSSTTETIDEISVVQKEEVNEQEVVSQEEESTVYEAEIAVESLIVKKVDGKYRYFFDIRNEGLEPFEGDIEIKLFNSEDLTLAKDVFSASKPIESGLGSSVYLDARTGPKSVDGTLGISSFNYTVRINGQDVDSGNGSISN